MNLPPFLGSGRPGGYAMSDTLWIINPLPLFGLSVFSMCLADKENISQIKRIQFSGKAVSFVSELRFP